jgi:uncharacterized protein (DUF885 family)
MIDRRSLLMSATALALAPAVGAAAAAPLHDQLNALFDAFMKEGLDLSPIGVTSLGMDKGERAYQKRLIDDESPAAIETGHRLTESQLTRLEALDRKALTGMDAVNYDTVIYGLRNQVAALRRFPYAAGNAGQPYFLNQLGGAYHDLPDFLDSQHQIETKEDADAYLARLSSVATAIDQESDLARHDAGLGVFAPDFVLDKTLAQLTQLRDVPAEKATLVQSLVRRAKEKNLPGDWSGPATALYEQKVRPALDRQIELARSLRAKAVHDAGVWRLPDGEAYYHASLLNWATTARPAAEIHATGLDLVEKISARMDELMRKQGLTQGTVGQRLRAMYDDPRYRYPNTDAGKDKLLADLNVKVSAVQARLPQWFGTLPKAKINIRRVPKEIEAGAPGGYYQGGALDGSRPGAYYINLRDTAEVPSWTLPTLTYHEAIPGHHLQISLAMEADLPLIRKVGGYSAYQEGWALYAEQLADEMGMYEGDPMGRIGYLHDACFRAVRLVIDTGLHAQRWSREKAVKYFTDTIGDQDASAITEVERYCVWPGQACSYMLGKLDWLRLREKAKAALGPRFDIRKFHDAGLLSGAMPLDVLDQMMEGWIAAQKA